jgi:hypothetical protein
LRRGRAGQWLAWRIQFTRRSYVPRRFASGRRPIGYSGCRGVHACSVAPSRIGKHILTGRITVITTALGHIIAWARCRRCAGDRTRCPARDCPDCGTLHPPGQKATQQPAYDGATNRARAGIWRRRCWWWRWWCSFISRLRRAIGRDGNIVGVFLGDVGRSPFQPLRIIVPNPADIPPPSVPPIVDFVPPSTRLPGYPATIRCARVSARGRRTSDESRIRSTPGCRGRGRTASSDWRALHGCTGGRRDGRGSRVARVLSMCCEPNSRHKRRQ